jgi:hypothetical protein
MNLNLLDLHTYQGSMGVLTPTLPSPSGHRYFVASFQAGGGKRLGLKDDREPVINLD